MKISASKIGFVLGPLSFILIMLFFNPDDLEFQGKAILACASWIAIWWVTEPIPIAATSLLPIIIFPLSGGLDIKTTTAAFGHKYVFLFIGSFILAIAIQKWKLHKRIALNIINQVGVNKSNIILGFMTATAFLSMWISNTATSVMILPVGLAIISQLKDDPNTPENENSLFGKALMLAIAYSASIGGMATIIGTPPNMIFAGVIKESYNIEISFFDWFKFGLPLSIFFLFICLCPLVDSLDISSPSPRDRADNLVKLAIEGRINPLKKETSAFCDWAAEYGARRIENALIELDRVLASPKRGEAILHAQALTRFIARNIDADVMTLKAAIKGIE